MSEEFSDLPLDDRLAKLFQAVESSPVMVLITDSAGIIKKVNGKFSQTTGYDVEETIGRHVSLTGEIPSALAQEINRKLDSGTEWTGKLSSFRKNGEEYWEEASIFPIMNHEGLVTHHVKVAEDITLRKKTEETVKFLAYYDDLTELPNRRLFLDRVGQAIHRNSRYNELLAVMTLDIDDFKKVNNALGHAIGDQVLEKLSRRLSDALRSCDTVAHYSGDCFKILLSRLSLPDHASTVARKLLKALEEPVAVEGEVIHFTASIGIALFPADGDNAATLLNNSSLAMQRAKKSGRNCYHYFMPAMHKAAMKRISMENGLRKALERQEFFLHYQPQIDCHSSKMVGMEALVRWRNPELGTVQPNDFIPLSEETGFIIPLGEWVLAEAADQVSRWLAMDLPPMRMAVNLSPRQFLQKNLLHMISDILNRTSFPPWSLELEITENALTVDVAKATEILKSLRGMGVSIAIDDFGTGYSSLSLLKNFPLDTLKIDRSFIRNVTEDSSNAAIVSAVIAMAHDLGLKVVAEGVETQVQDDFLREHGCDFIQGYFRGRPVAAEQIVEQFR